MAKAGPEACCPETVSLLPSRMSELVLYSQGHIDAQAWRHLKGGEEGRAPPSGWERYWNKRHSWVRQDSQSRAGGKAKGTKGWSQEEREKPGAWGSPWIHTAREHMMRWALANMRHSATCWRDGVPLNSTPGQTSEAPSSPLQPSDPF